MHGRGSTHSTPRWVKVLAITAMILSALAVGLHLVGMAFLGETFGGHSGYQSLPGLTEHARQHPWL